MAKKVGSLLVDVAMNVAKVSRDVQTINNKFDKFGKNSAKAFNIASKAFAGIFSVAAVHRAVSSLQNIYKEVISTADSIAKFSTRIGISTSSLSEFHYAAERAGIDTRTFDMALQRMVRRIGEAAAGTGEAKQAIKELGLDAARLKMIGPDKAFLAISDALNKVANEFDRTRYAQKLFDSEGVRVLQLINQGTAAINEYAAEARRLGIVIDNDFRRAAEQAADAATKLNKAILGLKIEGTKTFTNDITEITNALTEFLIWFRKNKDELWENFRSLSAFGYPTFGLTEGGFGPQRIKRPVGGWERRGLGEGAVGAGPPQYDYINYGMMDAHVQAYRTFQMQQQVNQAAGAVSIGAGINLEEISRVDKALQEISDNFADTYKEANEAALTFRDSQKGVGIATEALTSLSWSMEYGFSSAFQNIITGTGSVQDAFAQMGRSIIGVISDIIARLLVVKLLEASLSLFKMVGGGGAAAGVQADLGPGYDIGNIAAGTTFGHKGGLVTKYGIRRYHPVGGMVTKLRPDEVPAILQVGERVIPKGTDGTAMPQVQVNVINQGTPQKISKQMTRMDQRKMIVDLVLEDMGENPDTGRRFARYLPNRR